MAVIARADGLGLGQVCPQLLRMTGMNTFRRHAEGTRAEARIKIDQKSEGMVIYYER